MKKISTFWLALIVGVILEGIIAVSAMMFGAEFTRFGPANGFSRCIHAIHFPGLWIADRLPSSAAWLGLPVIIISAIILLSVISVIVISILRKFYAGKSKPAA
jgi:hypothetical protein